MPTAGVVIGMVPGVVMMEQAEGDQPRTADSGVVAGVGASSNTRWRLLV